MNRVAAVFAIVTLVAATSAQAGPTDLTATPRATFPQPKIIYIASGVTNNSVNLQDGTATSVHCSNWSGKVAKMRYEFYQPDGTMAKSVPATIANHAALTISTHPTVLFLETAPEMPLIRQGTLVVRSTETAVYCSAMVLDAATPRATGIALHMVRFEAQPGTVE
jgi:hypothetical protein